MSSEDERLQAREIMTLKEVAEYLQLAEKSVVRMAQAGKIPAAKIASQWRFMRTLVNDWLASQMELAPATEGVLEGALREALAPLSALFRGDLMNLSIRPGSKKEVLGQLIEPLERAKMIPDGKPFLNSLIRREMLTSTAVGSGVAIPHARVPIRGLFKEPAIAFGRCPEGTDFEAVDAKPVHLFFLICASIEETHLRLMAQVSYLIRRPGAIDGLADCGSAAEVGDLVRREEGSLSQETE